MYNGAVGSPAKDSRKVAAEETFELCLQVHFMLESSAHYRGLFTDGSSQLGHPDQRHYHTQGHGAKYGKSALGREPAITSQHNDVRRRGNENHEGLGPLRRCATDNRDTGQLEIGVA